MGDISWERIPASSDVSVTLKWIRFSSIWITIYSSNCSDFPNVLVPPTPLLWVVSENWEAVAPLEEHCPVTPYFIYAQALDWAALPFLHSQPKRLRAMCESCLGSCKFGLFLIVPSQETHLCITWDKDLQTQSTCNILRLKILIQTINLWWAFLHSSNSQTHDEVHYLL